MGYDLLPSSSGPSAPSGRFEFAVHFLRSSRFAVLALAVLVRSPRRLDLARGTRASEVPLARLAERLHRAGFLSDGERRAVREEPLELSRPAAPVAAAPEPASTS